jgi:phosphatidate cytidylyltransferase
VSELTRRILFALVGAPATVALIYFGGWILATALGVVSAVCAWELFRMARAGGSNPMAAIGITLAALIPLFVHAHYLGVYTVSITDASLIFLALIASVIWVRGVAGQPLVSVSVTLFGILYAALTTFIYPLRYHEYAIGALAGTALVMFPIAVTWGTDIGAYAFGRMFGKRKLMPSVSPGKTVAGAIGGIAAAIASSWFYITVFLKPFGHLALTPLGMILFGIAISVAGQTGDLAESLLKREAGVKDSSSLLPGHGGLLDRWDSLLFTVPVAYLILGYLLIPAPG